MVAAVPAHEPVVLGLKPLVALGHLGVVGLVERVLVIGVLCAPGTVRPAVPSVLVG